MPIINGWIDPGAMFSDLSLKHRLILIVVIILATLAPPLALALSVQYVANTHFIATHLSQTNPGRGDVRPGDVIAVTGRVRGTPAHLAGDVPKFAPALMVQRLFEVFHHGKRGGWAPNGTDTWVADAASIAGWRLDADLIQSAGFDSYPASPCSDYRPPAGWAPSCPDSKYVINRGDSDLRMAYIVTPLNDQEYTLIAAVAWDGGSLVPMVYSGNNHESVASVLVLARGVRNPNAVLVEQALTGILMVALSWLAVFIDAGVWMFIALGRNGSYAGMERLRGVAWRSGVIGAPLIAFCLGVPPDYAGIVDMTAVTVSAMIGGFLWFHTIEG